METIVDHKCGGSIWYRNYQPDLRIFLCVLSFFQSGGNGVSDELHQLHTRVEKEVGLQYIVPGFPPCIRTS